MLTTRCPHCQTTYRITSVVLHKAAGDVRCGQCRAIFNAFDSLTDTLRASNENSLPYTTQSPQASGDSESGTAEIPAEPLEDAPAPQPPSEEPALAQTDQPEPGATVDPQPGYTAPAEVFGDRREPAESVEPQPDTPAASDDAPTEQPMAAAPWRPAEQPEAESGAWRIAAILAATALLLQAAHHYRAALTRIPYFGVQLERVYALAGSPIEHYGRPQDFSIVDWVATAQQSDVSAPGRLEITAGVRNESDSSLQYPMLLLELTDRWEQVIGSRVFVPEEYMGTRISQNARIQPETTVTAHLNLVDPGPDAYGFEVDVCVPADGGRMQCKSDLVFQ